MKKHKRRTLKSIFGGEVKRRTIIDWNDPEEVKKYQNEKQRIKREKIKKNKIQKRKNNEKRIKKIYGITIEEYNNILDNQNNCCSICKKNKSEFKKSFSIDHDHRTGKIRGLLCQNCNSLLGLAFDNIIILSNAIKYLENNNEQ